MKHIFIINPAAGQGESEKIFLPKIRATLLEEGADFEIYCTTAPGDCQDFVRKCGETGEDIRVYACGGDGTLNEVVNGAYGLDNVQVGIIPAGTGNDFCRNFNGGERFSDIKSQLYGSSIWIDAVSCNGRLGINMFNIGFDSEVVDETARLKKKPFLSGSIAYLAGVVTVFVRKMGHQMTVSIDDGPEMEEKFLLAAVANGGYCGGGFFSAPYAALSDGMMDVSLIRMMSRANLIAMLGKYKVGAHLQTKIGERYIGYQQCKKIHICSQTPMKLCTDGEITLETDVTFEIIPHAIRLALPSGASVKQVAEIMQPVLV